jgi:hypothetical protein
MEATASVRDRQTESERKKEKGKSIQNMTAKMAGKDEHWYRTLYINLIGKWDIWLFNGTVSPV